MPTPGVDAPNTSGIVTGIQTLVQAVIWPSIGNTTQYKTIAIGERKDVTNQVPLLTIRAQQGDVERYTTGGKIKDRPRFILRTYVDYTTVQAAQVAEEQLYAIRDAVTPVFNQKTALNGVTGVLECMWERNSEKYGYITVNGQWYRIHEHVLSVVQSYTLVGGFTQ